MELSGSVSLGLFSKHGSGRIIKLNNLPNNTMLSADKIRRYECSHDKDDNSIQLLIFCKCTRLFNYFWIDQPKINERSPVYCDVIESEDDKTPKIHTECV